MNLLLAALPDAADQRIQFKVRWKSLDNPVPASDLSDGTLRFLCLLAILANPNPPPLIAIDEPETGLRQRGRKWFYDPPGGIDALTPFNPTTTIVESQITGNESPERLEGNTRPLVEGIHTQEYSARMDYIP